MIELVGMTDVVKSNSEYPGVNSWPPVGGSLNSDLVTVGAALMRALHFEWTLHGNGRTG